MTDMKPCPFCGNDALSIDSSYFRDTLIYCCECDMYFTLDSFKATREEVIEAWNIRAERTAKVEKKGIYTDAIHTGYCGECGHHLVSPNDVYCPGCGAKLEWEEATDESD